MNWALIALLTATPQSAPAPKPWLGVNMGPHNAKIEAKGKSYKHGIRISRVVLDSPAYKAGLRAGDIVVRVGDDKLDCKSEELLNRMRQQIVSHNPIVSGPGGRTRRAAGVSASRRAPEADATFAADSNRGNPADTWKPRRVGLS